MFDLYIATRVLGDRYHSGSNRLVYYFSVFYTDVLFALDSPNNLVQRLERGIREIRENVSDLLNILHSKYAFVRSDDFEETGIAGQRAVPSPCSLANFFMGQLTKSKSRTMNTRLTAREADSVINELCIIFVKDSGMAGLYRAA